MRKTMLVLTCLSGLAAGCDQASDAADQQFAESFRTNCISSATGGQLSPDLVEKACDCALGKIEERYSTAEKLALTNEQAGPIAMECLAEVRPDNG